MQLAVHFLIGCRVPQDDPSRSGCSAFSAGDESTTGPTAAHFAVAFRLRRGGTKHCHTGGTFDKAFFGQLAWFFGILDHFIDVWSHMCAAFMSFVARRVPCVFTMH